MRTLKIVLTLLLFCSTLLAAKPEFSGYMKSYPVVIVTPKADNPDEFQTIFNVHNRARLNLAYAPKSWIQFKVSYELFPQLYAPHITESQKAELESIHSPYRVGDPDRLLYPETLRDSSRSSLGHNIDSLAVTFEMPIVAVTIGRQSLGWGAAKIVNPTDILTPFTFSTIDKEERVGIDAIIARFQVGMMHEIEAGYLFGDKFKFKESAFFLRGKFVSNIGDFAATVIEFKENLLLGGEWDGTIGGAGARLEFAHVMDNIIEEKEYDATGDYFRLSAGADYQFTDKLYAYCEYHFNGAGMRSNNDLNRVYESTAFAEGSVYLTGRHYSTLGMTYQFHPLFTGTATAMTNMTDPSVSLMLSGSYSLHRNENISMDLGTNLNLGDKGNGDGEYSSEFGPAPRLIYYGFKFYF